MLLDMSCYAYSENHVILYPLSSNLYPLIEHPAAARGGDEMVVFGKRKGEHLLEDRS